MASARRHRLSPPPPNSAAGSRQSAVVGHSPRFAAVLRLARDQVGVAAVEYALLCALVGLAVVGGISELGTESSNNFSDVQQAVAEASDDGAGDASNGRGKGKANGNGRGKGNGNRNGNGRGK